MLLLTLDEASREPKSRQILTQVRSLIEGGTLSPGDRLPSTRQLSEALALHRSTVALAYQELWALGYVDLSQGARPRVRERIPLVRADEPAGPGAIDWTATASAACNDVLTAFRRFRPLTHDPGDTGIIDFSRLDMDPRLLPSEALRACVNAVLREEGDSLLGYSDPAGYAPLRGYLAERLHSHGISVDASDVLITGGAQQALDLVFRMVAAPGRNVAVETPTYDCVLPLLRLNGLTPVAVPLRHDGLDLDALAVVLERERPALVYTMPSFQNPTGVATSQAHRERLLALCEQRGVPLVEDGFDEEMKYFGRVVLPIKSMDRSGVVIYCGTFSKVLFPGVRIGWVAATRDCIARLTAIRRFAELSQSAVLQAAVDRFCRDGHYDRHISRMHRVFRGRMQALTAALRQHIAPEWATWSDPSGGYLVWLKLKALPDGAPDLTALLTTHGVRVAAGDTFFAAEPDSPHIRLSITGLAEAEIETGIRRLAGALRSLYGEARQ